MDIKTVKAISLTQPWASLIALGFKRIETRGWSTRYRGPLAIHAAKSFPKKCKQLCTTDPFKTCLEGSGLKVTDLPLGMVVATCKLVDCFPTEWGHFNNISDIEQAFGNYALGRFCSSATRRAIG